MLTNSARLRLIHVLSPRFNGRMQSEIIQAGKIRPKPPSVDDLQQPTAKKIKLKPSSDGLIHLHGDGEKKGSRKQRKRQKLPEPCSVEDVLWQDVVSVLGKDVVQLALEDGSEWDSPFEYRTEVELVVSILSSHGKLCYVLS